MASDYSLNLKAQLDTSDVQAKLQQLGNTGSVATSQLEDSIKKLDTAVKDLSQSWKTSAKEAQQTGFQMQKILRGGAAMLLGSAISRMGNYAAATGNTTGAQAASLAGGLLKGAGAGAAMGSAIPVVGTGVGAAVGAVVGALEVLADAAIETARKLNESFQSARDYIQAEGRKADMQQRLEGLSGIEIGSTEWNNRRSELRRRIQEYEEGRAQIADEAKGRYGPDAWIIGSGDKTDEVKQYYVQQAEKLKELENAAKDASIELDKMIKMEQELADAEKEKAQAAEEEENAMSAAVKAAGEKAKADEEAAQKSMAEAAAKAQAEFLRTSGAAGSALGSFQRDRRLEAFEASLEDMSPADLMHLRDSLAGQKASAAAQVESLFGTAKQSGQASDLEAAQNALQSFNEIARMLSLTEAGIGGITTPSIQQQMMALGSEAQKGYDTSGYGSIDQEILKSEKSTEQNTKEAASTLKTINTKLEEVKTVITSNANGANWQ